MASCSVIHKPRWLRRLRCISGTLDRPHRHAARHSLPPGVARDSSPPTQHHEAMTAPATDWPEAEQRIAQIARTRRGRHRDRALASWRRTRAIELRAAGMSYDQIATEVGYANRGTAHNVVTQALAAREAQSVDQMRHLELARLEAAHAALWPRAMQGHVPWSRRCCASWTWNAGCKASTSQLPSRAPRTTGTTARDPLLS